MPYTLLGQQQNLSHEPETINGKTYVPLREVITALGGTLDWDNNQKIAAARLGQWRATVHEGATNADVSGTPVTFSAPLVVKDGAAWVPADFFQSAYGYQVTANGTNVTIVNPNG